ncbi:MAG TPA: sigma-70 family RNA polymerase sigma factor, partial [Polyangiaceae bacterium]|nr:sigma-70 family RNA polymerase sigma factor [Polyangiaceae bacterium]
MLDREYETTLFLRWRAEGDTRAADEIVRASLPSVVMIAQKYRRYNLREAELIAEGNFGLVKALSKFDPTRGNRFMTYATYWIRAYVIDYVIRSWSLVGAGSGALRSRHFFKLRRERARVTNLLGEGEQAERVLAERVGVNPAELSSMLRRLEVRDVSLDLPPVEGATPLADRLPAPGDVEKDLAERESLALMLDPIHAAVSSLDQRERYIVEHRLMADSEDELSLAQIGRNLGVSRERA